MRLDGHRPVLLLHLGQGDHAGLYKYKKALSEGKTKEEALMNIENTQAQMRKGILEYCILLIIARNDAYVQDIINKLRASKMLVVEGTVYPLLTRLKNTGLLAYRWEESTQGPPRKYYNITEQGRQFLQALETSWEELTTAIEILKAPHTPQ